MEAVYAIRAFTQFPQVLNASPAPVWILNAWSAPMRPMPHLFMISSARSAPGGSTPTAPAARPVHPPSAYAPIAAWMDLPATTAKWSPTWVWPMVSVCAIRATTTTWWLVQPAPVRSQCVCSANSTALSFSASSARINSMQPMRSAFHAVSSTQTA